VDFTETEIPGVLVIRPKKHADERGFFSETFRESEFAARGMRHGWAQENHSRSLVSGVVRGLHFQAPPKAQAKLLRVIRGAILDVVVDIRRGSPTFGKHVAIELSEDNWTQIYVPVGMAHGFCTLSKEADVLYKTSETYAPETEGGVHWLDSDIGVRWPVEPAKATLTAKDARWPRLAEQTSPFEWKA